MALQHIIGCTREAADYRTRVHNVCVTCLPMSITWLASRVWGKATPNSEANESRGDSVPEAKMMLWMVEISNAGD